MKKIMLLRILILIMIMPIAYPDIISTECEDVGPYDYEGLMKCQVDTYASSANKVMQDQMEELTEEIIDSTKGEGFEIEKSAGYFQIFRYLFGGILVLVTMLTGYQYMISNEDPTKREEAKKTFKYIIFAGILVAALPLIMWETHETSNAMNTMIMGISELDEADALDLSHYIDAEGTGVEQSMNRFSKLYTNVPLFTTAATAYIISMNARHILVLLLVALAPMILLMWIFTPTKEYGKLLTYLFGLELFLPIVNIIAIHFSIILSGAELDMMMLSSALIVAIGFHIILILTTIFKATTTIVNQIRYGGEE